jgi:hypothetical protein
MTHQTKEKIHRVRYLTERRIAMLETIIVILVVLWLFGYIGPVVIPAIPQSGNLVHVLLVVALIFIVVSLARGRRI